MNYLSPTLTCIPAKLLVALLFFLSSLQALAVEIDFTRHLSLYPESARQQPESEVSFFGVPGDARLIVSSPGNMVNATIQLNGVELISAGHLDRTKQVEVPVTLLENNIMTVSLNTIIVHPFSIRIKQIADIQLPLTVLERDIRHAVNRPIKNEYGDIEKAMLLQQSGEISLKDLRRLESTLKTDCRARETKKMNNAIIKAAQENVTDSPLNELTRTRILAAGRDAITDQRPKSALPWMAAAAVLVLFFTLAWAQELAAKAPLSLRYAKQALNDAMGGSIDETISNEAVLQELGYAADEIARLKVHGVI